MTFWMACIVAVAIWAAIFGIMTATPQRGETGLTPFLFATAGAWTWVGAWVLSRII